MTPPAARPPEGFPDCCPICGEVMPDAARTGADEVQCPQCGGLTWSRLWTLHEECPFLLAEACVPELEATTGTEVLKTLIDRLVEVGALQENCREEVLAALIKREELGSTGIGRGIAVPHCRNAAVSKVVGAWGHSRQGIDFQALDGLPVHNFFLLISPPEQPADHLHALEQLSRKIRQWEWREE